MKNYVTGIIGGLIGGVIAAVPWILMYVYGGYILSILAAFIATGFLFGYRKLNGPINKNTPAIIGISSVLIIVIVTLVVIPLIALNQEEIPATFENLKILYEYSDFFKSIMGDLVVSVIFTILGIGGVLNQIKQEVANN